MNQNWDLSQISRKVNRAVKDAMRLDKGGLDNLAKDISDIGKEIGGIGKDFSNIGKEFSRGFAGEDRRYEPTYRPGEQNPEYKIPHSNHGPQNQAVAKPPSVSVAGILMVVFGSIGLGLLTLLTIALIISSLLPGLPGNFYGISAGILGIFYGISGGFLAKGISLCRRNKRFCKYKKEIRGGDFCPIGMLASAIGQTESFVVKDLRKMIRKGMFPGSHLDSRQTCLILNYETYQQYLHAEEEMKRRQLQDDEQRKLKDQDEKNRASQRAGNGELSAVIAEGKNYIKQIRLANDLIPGEEISRKISLLEQVTTKIFEYVELHPNKLPEIRKFMSYYLPTTLKLLDAYKVFDNQPLQGENITSAKQEIQATLDTINLAFNNLLDSLFGDVVLDISTDISVLESMLAQEGLTGSDFKK